MIAKRSSRTSQPPEAPAGIIQRLTRPIPGNAASREKANPGVISREVAGNLLSPSNWSVLTTQLPALAAALAYRTIFGLVPVLVIGLMVIGAYAEEKEISTAVTRLLHFAGLDQVAVDGVSVQVPMDPDQGTVVVDPPPVTDKPVGSDVTKPAVSSQRLDEWIGQLVKQVRTIPFRTIGFIGLGALIYAALSMLVEIERAFNQIYRVPSGRSWWSRVTRYWTLLTLGSIGLFATFYATDAFLTRIDKVDSWSIRGLFSSEKLPDEPISAGPGSSTPVPATGKDIGTPVAAAAPTSMFSIRTIAGFAVTVLISTAFLTIIYSVVPNARVRLTAGVSGAFVGALLWEAAKWGFAYYVKSAGYSKLYGAVALLPLFLLWIYLAWMIVLLGLFVSYLVQTRGSKPITVLSDGRTSIVDPASILLVAGAVAREFRAGRSSDAQTAARMTGIEQGVVVSMLESMVARGMLHRVAAGDEEDRFALARPPEAIDVAECLAIGSEMVDQTGARNTLMGVDTSLVSAIRPLQVARAEAAKGRSLADLLGMSPVEAEKQPVVESTPAAAANALPAADPTSRIEASMGTPGPAPMGG